MATEIPLSLPCFRWSAKTVGVDRYHLAHAAMIPSDEIIQPTVPQMMQSVGEDFQLTESLRHTRPRPPMQPASLPSINLWQASRRYTVDMYDTRLHSSPSELRILR